MLAASELIYLNTLYMFCALTCAWIETPVKTRPKQLKRLSEKSASMEFTFTIWTCLYVATLLSVCTLPTRFSDTNARHRICLFVVLYFTNCFLLSIFAELLCVFRQRFQINFWGVFSYHKCYCLDSFYCLSLRRTRGYRISRFALFYRSCTSCRCFII